MKIPLNCTKKTGIAADNYKLDLFRSKLDAKGYTYTIVPFTKDTSLIKVNFYVSSQIADIKRICHEVEYHFKRSN